MKQLLLLTFSFFCIGTLVHSQKNIAEKLGYPKNAKLLILHADDAGVAYSVDAATIAAFEKHSITSASIMVPCPWFYEIAAYAKAHPEMDWGLHITLTAEWKNYKWDGVLSSDKIASLLDTTGYFYASVEEFVKHAKPEEVEAEVRAQVERAIRFGIKVTHLDSHMGSLFATPGLFKIFQKIGSDYGIPVFQPGNLPGLAIDTNHVVVNVVYMASKVAPAKDWHTYYDSVIQQIKPGLNEIILHLAFDDAEMQAVAIDHADFGATWRQNDFNYFTSDALKTLLKKNNIQLITWGDIKNMMKVK